MEGRKILNPPYYKISFVLTSSALPIYSTIEVRDLYVKGHEN